MTIDLRTSRWQLAAIVVGWGLFAFIATFGFSTSPSFVGLCASLGVLGFMAWTYPLTCVVSPEDIMVRTCLRRRSIPWSDVVAIRRAKGMWQRQLVAGKQRIRPAPGAILIVLESRRTVLALGHVEPQATNRLLVDLVGDVSPALAVSLRLDPDDGQ